MLRCFGLSNALAKACLLLIFSFSFAHNCQAQSPSQNFTLEPNVAIEKEITVGYSHNYLLKLQAGQTVQIEVEQRGINVLLNVFDPADKFLFFVDRQWSKTGIEKALIAAEVSGEYRLWLAPQGAANATNISPGKYEVRITHIQATTSQDQLRYNSQILYSEAILELTNILSRRDSTSVPSKAEEWLRKYRDLEDYQVIGGLLNGIGDSYEILHQYKKALEYREQEIALRQSRGEQLSLAFALERIASTYYLIGDHQKAELSKQSALTILQNLGNRRLLQGTFSSFGYISLRLRDEQQALDYFNQALAIARELNDATLIIKELANIAEAYSLLRDWDKAFEYHNQALAVARESNNKRSEAMFLSELTTDISQIEGFRDRGELLIKRSSKATQVISMLEKSRLLYQGLNDPYESDPLSTLALWYALNGDRGTALSAVEQALTLGQGLAAVKQQTIILNACSVYSVLGNQEQAVELISKTYQRFNTTQDVGATITSALAQQLYASGKLDAARVKIEEAIFVKESLRGRLNEQEHRINVASNISDDYEFYADLLMQLHEQKPEQRLNEQAFLASERARARSLLDLLVEARANIRSGVDPALLERERSLQQKINSLSPRPNDPQKNNPPAAIQKELAMAFEELQKVRAQIRVASPHFAALTEPQTPSVAEIQKQLLDADTMLLAYSLGEKRSFLWAISQNSIASYQLPPREILTKSARRVYELLTTQQQLQAAAPAQRQKQIAQAEKDYQIEAAALSEMLLGSVATQLGQKRLLVVAPEALQYLPFGALPEPEEFRVSSSESRGASQTTKLETQNPKPLIVNHEIINLPSVSVMMLLRQELAQRQAAPKALAVFADPVFAANDPRVKAQALAKNDPTAALSLPSPLTQTLRSFNLRAGLARLILSRDEAETIVSTLPESERLKALDFKASRAEAMSESLSQYRIVHFATHGLLNAERPELSGLVFSLVDKEGKPQDGFLRLHEIYNLQLPAELVVLSACQSGLGKDIKGEGMIGLTRGFMYAGAARVVASLWRVDDYATSVLMKKFYRGMLQEKLPAAAALRKAQIEMWQQKQWRSPFYWGAFTMQGEWK